MRRFYKSYYRFSDFARERYTNSINEVLLVIGIHKSFSLRMYDKSDCFEEYYRNINEKISTVKHKKMKFILENRGYKEIRDRLNNVKKQKESKYYKSEVLSLGRKRKNFPIQFPTRSVEIINEVENYLKDNSDLYSFAVSRIQKNCKFNNSDSSTNKDYCAYGLLGFIYEEFISKCDKNSKAHKGFEMFKRDMSESSLVNKCMDMGR